MFESKARQTPVGGAFQMMEVIYHSVVRSIRRTHNNAFMAIAMNILQVVILLGAFYLMFSILGLRGSAIRGDFVLFIMSGIFLYMTHTRTVAAVVGAEGPSSPMMQHAPMNTIVAIASAAIGALYIQVLSMFAVLFVYHVAFNPFEVDDPAGAFAMLLLSWFTGFSVGLVLLALKPWFPSTVSILSSIYQRVNMIASGKMFVANALPGFMLAMFDWNPLFHCIDQARGFVFINYNPHYSSWQYAFWVGVVLTMIGLMGEFYTRRHASLSWSARN